MGIFDQISQTIMNHANSVVQANPQGSAGGAASGAAGQAVSADQVLDGIAQQKGNPDLNYKSSIVDLMKLLDMDSSLDKRKQLAGELGYQGPQDGSAEMNIWLHRQVMQRLAANGGVVPANLTD